MVMVLTMIIVKLIAITMAILIEHYIIPLCCMASPSGAKGMTSCRGLAGNRVFPKTGGTVFGVPIMVILG